MHYDLIIVGGGPAGVTAGIYGARQKLNILLIAKTFGGQMTRKSVAIENYPGFPEISGFDLMKKFTEHLKKNNIEVLPDTVASIKKMKQGFLVSTKGKKKLTALAVIIASGADPRPLKVPGEKKFIGKGISYCAQCDGPMFGGKIVVVVGGGNSGFETSLSLKNFASKVYILEFNREPKADEDNQKKVGEISKIEVITNAVVKKIRGKDFVESIVYQDRASKKLKILNVQGVFVEIGNIPATSFVKGLVEFNEKDEIKIDPMICQTRTSGLFAAGDVTDVRDKQIVVAAGEGTKAALSANAYIQKLKN